MTKPKAISGGAVLTMLMAAVVWAANAPSDEELLKKAQALFRPLPRIMDSRDNQVTAAKVALGKMLYYEPRLSRAT